MSMGLVQLLKASARDIEVGPRETSSKLLSTLQCPNKILWVISSDPWGGDGKSQALQDRVKLAQR